MTPDKITELWVFLATVDGVEGIPVAVLPDTGAGKQLLQMVTADPEAIDDIRRAARQLQKHTGTPIRLCRFVLADEVGPVEPPQ